MKAKKALKKLTRTEALLSSVLHQYAKKHQHIRVLLESAKDSIIRVREAISPPASPMTGNRPAAKAEENSPRDRAGRGSKAIVPTSKKPSVTAKRKRAANKRSGRRSVGKKRAPITERRRAKPQTHRLAGSRTVASRAARKKPSQTAGKPAAMMNASADQRHEAVVKAKESLERNTATNDSIQHNTEPKSQPSPSIPKASQ